MTEKRVTTPTQATGVVGAAILLLELLKSGVNYMVGISWNWSQIDVDLASGWIKEVLAIVAIIIGAIKAFDWTRNWRPKPEAPQRELTPQEKAVLEASINHPMPVPGKWQVPVPDIGLYDSATEPRNYFDQDELECKGMDCNCVFPGMDPVLMHRANLFRAEHGRTVVNSAYRCPIHNRDVKGKKDSQHQLGKAMDIRNARVTPEQIYTWFDTRWPDEMGLIIYDRFCHVDTRRERYREDKRTKSIV